MLRHYRINWKIIVLSEIALALVAFAIGRWMAPDAITVPAVRFFAA